MTNRVRIVEWLMTGWRNGKEENRHKSPTFVKLRPGSRSKLRNLWLLLTQPLTHALTQVLMPEVSRNPQIAPPHGTPEQGFDIL